MPFRLPIDYCNKKRKLFDNLYDDLELLDGEKKGMYEYLFSPTTKLGKKMLKSWSEYYTTNRRFLRESQKLYDSFENDNINKECTEKMWDIWHKIKTEDNFLEKYQYVEWEKIAWLNKYSPFLSFMSFYNLASPLLNLILPFIMLLIPFFLLKIMKIPITFSSYKNALLHQLKNHSIGRIFTEFALVTWDKRIYILLSLGMYLYNIYQNILSCYHFYINMRCLDNYFTTIREYIDYTIEKMNIIINKTKNLKTYEAFILDVISYRNELIKIGKTWTFKTVLSTNGFFEVGNILKQFYLIYADPHIEDVFKYSFNFNGYWDTVIGLHKNLNIQNACFNKKIFIFKNAIYPPLCNDNPVKNTIILDKNMIITGPNAAGKTTLLKCALINILFTQQVGKGYYDNATIMPFDYIHCYLNIPDTSARDSLFQAEARRCKDILSLIESSPNKKHFCIFDELYSGTNHSEAIGSAHSYLKYISENSKVRFMITTHFTKLCNLLEKEKNIKNAQMETSMKEDIPIYTYKIIDGISKIKGGICVLRELRYPSKILKMTEKTIRTL